MEIAIFKNHQEISGVFFNYIDRFDKYQEMFFFKSVKMQTALD